MSPFLHPKLMAEHFEEDLEPRLKRLLATVLKGMAANG
jgi:hypothetical protein